MSHCVIRAHGSYRSTSGYNHDPTYTSLSHSWSSGPTSAMTYYLLGLTVEPDGQWALRPCEDASVNEARGGFSTPNGKYATSWKGEEGKWCIEVDVPEGMNGIVRMGFRGRWEVDGKAIESEVEDGTSRVRLAGGRRLIDVIREM